MNMTKEEIVRDYKQAAAPMKQIGILADLNQCDRKEIVEILREAGCELPKQYQPKEKKAPEYILVPDGIIHNLAGASGGTGSHDKEPVVIKEAAPEPKEGPALKFKAAALDAIIEELPDTIDEGTAIDFLLKVEGIITFAMILTKEA